MNIKEYKDTYCTKCKSNNCALVLNTEQKAQCVFCENEKQNSK